MHGTINRPYVGQIDRMFGTLDWRMILAAREDGVLTPAQTRDDLVNLMRWRLVNILGYHWCVPLTVVNTRGRQIFDLLFATDHFAEKIMREVFGVAGHDLDLVVAGRVENEQRAIGQDTLELDYVPAARTPPPMSPTLPPREPFRYRRRWERDQEPTASDPRNGRREDGLPPSAFGRPTA